MAALTDSVSTIISGAMKRKQDADAAQALQNFGARAKALALAHQDTDKAIKLLVDHHDLPVDADPDTDSKATQRQAMLDAVRKNRLPEMKPLRGPIGPMLADGAAFRNNYNSYKKTGDQDALAPHLDQFQQGLPGILNAITKAVGRSTASAGQAGGSAAASAADGGATSDQARK
jgi:hypothetical protein